MALSDLVVGGGGKSLTLPFVRSRIGDGDIANKQGFSIPLYLPKVTNAARDFTSSGNFTLGLFVDKVNGGVLFYAPINEYFYKDFTIDTGHQMTSQGVNVIRASGTVTIGGNGIIGASSALSAANFLNYDYNYPDETNGGFAPGSNGAADGGGASGGGNTIGTSGRRGGGDPVVYNVADDGEGGIGGANAGAGGGYCGFNGGGGAGGAGGGVAGDSIASTLVICADTITINGNISFNGTSGAAGSLSSAGGGGGGAGASVYLFAKTINLTSGTVNVSGGNGGNGANGVASTGGAGGGGGGGHCGLCLYQAKTISGAGVTFTGVVGTGGTGGTGGAPDGFDGGDGADGGFIRGYNTGIVRIEGDPF